MKLVLVLDPNADIQEWLSLSMRRRGLDVLATGDLQHALYLCKAASPSVILFESRIPGIRPQELVEQLRIAAPRAKLVLFTATHDPAGVARSLRVSGFIEKPTDTDLIEARLWSECMQAACEVSRVLCADTRSAADALAHTMRHARVLREQLLRVSNASRQISDRVAQRAAVTH